MVPDNGNRPSAVLESFFPIFPDSQEPSRCAFGTLLIGIHRRRRSHCGLTFGSGLRSPNSLIPGITFRCSVIN